MDQGLALPLTKRLTPRHWLAVDWLLAVLLASTFALGEAVDGRPHQSGAGWTALRIIAIGLACGALPPRRRRPDLALWMVTPALAVLVALRVRGPIELTAAIVIYSVAATSDRRRSLRSAAALIAAVVFGALIATGSPAWGGLVSNSTIIAIGWLLGENARSRRAYAHGLAERAAERERERVQRALRAAADERVRIARELHDVVAHAMSVVAVRSGVARLVMDTNPEEVREALAIIETTSRRALNEMRLLVGVLRQPEDPAAELLPAPGLTDLPDLLTRIAQAGVAVTMTVEGDAPPLPPGVDLSAYRIVQEALTNVVRHAGPAAARLSIRYQPGVVEIEVLDDGGSRGRAAAPLAADGQGHGLVGMKERVGLFGGELSAGPAGRGFRVLARLRLDEVTA